MKKTMILMTFLLLLSGVGTAWGYCDFGDFNCTRKAWDDCMTEQI